jgi:hypothetical protein
MISDKEGKKCMKASVILEIIGRPAEHLVESLEKIIKSIAEEKGMDVAESKINEPVPMKDQKDFFTTFAEVEVDIEEAIHLVALIFKYMPAHIEIISPETLSMTNNDFNEIFNELVMRLHSYDEVAGVLQMEKKILEDKLRQILGQISEAKKKAGEKKEDGNKARKK